MSNNGHHQANEIRNVIIVGSGPAGYTAALYTARANLNPLLIAGSLDPKTSRIKGGQLMYTSDIENFPGAIYFDGIADIEKLSPEAELVAQDSLKGLSGPDLMKRMELQARHFGAEMLEEFVLEARLDEDGIHTLVTESGQSFRTRALIIATGAAAKTLGIEAEDKFFGQGGGVSTCATCDGHSYLGKVVAVVGGGDSAMEEAAYLSRLVKKVYLIHRREEFRASKIMLKRAQENPKIEFTLNATIADIIGKPHPLGEKIAFYKNREVVGAALLKDTRDGQTREVELDGIFVAIGHTPNSHLFQSTLRHDEAGYLQHDGHTRALASDGATIVPGVFLAGDISDHIYRQAITAAGMGCQAAIEVERYLAEKLAEEVGVSPAALSLSTEAIAQSHWSSERDEMGEKPMIERIVEAESVMNETVMVDAQTVGGETVHIEAGATHSVS